MKYFLTPREYGLINPRVNGFKKLQGINAKTIDVYLTTQESFEYYKKNGRFPNGFEEELKICVADLLNKWPGYFLITRRAYVVPGVENPPGPHLTSSDVSKNIKKLFQFAIEQHYDHDPDSQIIVFFTLLLAPKKLTKKIQKTLLCRMGAMLSAKAQPPSRFILFMA